MSAPTIVFLDESSVSSAEALAALQDSIEAEGWRYRAWPESAPAEVAGRLKGARAAITNKCPIGAEQLGDGRAGALRLVLVAATGYDIIDAEACGRAGVQLANVEGYAAGAVAQHTLALTLELCNRVRANHRHCRDGRWSASPRFCLFDDAPRELSAMTVGIVGHGAVGSKVAQAFGSLGSTVLLAARDGRDQRPGRVALADLLRRCDIISLHCPLDERSRHMIGAAQLALMPRQALIINTARGGLIDEAALAAALDERRIGGAGLDVLEGEPPPADSPLLHCADDRLVLSPHIAWAGEPSQRRLLDGVARNFIDFARTGRLDRPLSTVPPTVRDRL